MSGQSVVARATSEPVPPTVATRYGRMQIPDRDTDLIGRFLNTYGEWAMYEVRFVAGALEPGARVADVGAFAGTFSLGLMALLPLHSVCLVEANPRIAPLLRANMTRNSTIAFEVIEAVVVPASHQGSLQASVEPGNMGSFSVRTAAKGDKRAEAELTQRQITLAELQAEHGPFDVIKLDIEGLENPLLQESIDTFANGKTKLWLECSEDESSLQLCQTVLNAGLDVYYFAFPVFAADNYAQSNEYLFPWAYEAGLWVTKGKSPPLAPEMGRAGCLLQRIRSTEELRRALWDTPRWAPATLAGCDAPALAARAGHLLLGQCYEDFLTPAWDPSKTSWSKPLVAQLEEQCDQFKGELTQATSRARATEIMLHAERSWMERQCQAFLNDLEQARHTIALRDEQLGVFQRTVSGLQQQVVMLDQRSHTLGIIEGSTFYRVMLAARSLALRHRWLFRIARPILASGFRILRRVAGRRRL